MKISVVMAVRNGASQLSDTLVSILNQSEGDFELIVVDDGSTDDTAAVLASFKDPRLKVVAQSHSGLTQALVRGCDVAQGEFIARHDCGDLSMPDRFRLQSAVLTADSAVVLVSCATEVQAPGGETLYVATADGRTVRQSLLQDRAGSVRGLSHHGSAMFRRETYLRSGGYRTQFYFAQDLDLWVRLAPLGEIVFIEGEPLYVARFDPDSISAANRPEQIASTRLILEMRDSPGRTADLLTQAARIRRTKRTGRRSRAHALYFIASCLKNRRDPAWRHYARQALTTNPLHLRTWSLMVRK